VRYIQTFYIGPRVCVVLVVSSYVLFSRLSSYFMHLARIAFIVFRCTCNLWNAWSLNAWSSLVWNISRKPVMFVPMRAPSFFSPLPFAADYDGSRQITKKMFTIVALR